MKLPPHVLRSKESKRGEVTVPEAYVPHPNISHLRRWFKEAKRRGRDREIPRGEISREVIARAHNAEKVRDLLQLIALYPMKKTTPDGAMKQIQLYNKYGRHPKAIFTKLRRGWS